MADNRFNMAAFSQNMESQILQLLQGVLISDGNTPGRVISESPLPETKEEDLVCPGLVHDRNSRQKWYIPPGYTSAERTYCEACVKKYNLDCTLSKSITYSGGRGGCNCDSYLETNNMDNEIFNISVWSDDYRTYYTADDDGNVLMPSGNFHVLITYNYKKFIKHKRVFRATLYLNDKKLWVSPLTTNSILARNIGYFVNKASAICGLLPYTKGGFRVFTDSELKVSIDVFNIVNCDYGAATGCNFGVLIYKQDTMEMYQSVKTATTYDHPKQTYMYPLADSTTEAFTKKPIVMTYSLSSLPIEDDTAAYRVTKKLVGIMTDKIKAMKREAQRLVKDLTAKSTQEGVFAAQLELLESALKNNGQYAPSAEPEPASAPAITEEKEENENETLQHVMAILNEPDQPEDNELE